MSESYLRNVSDVTRRLKTASVDELPELIRRYDEDPRSSVQKALSSARKRLSAWEALVAHTEGLYAEQAYICGTGAVLGLDEVGRGAVAGPLTVAAVILPPDPLIIGIDDSKKLTPDRREELASEIRRYAIAIGIAHIPPEVIDREGMASCLRQAMCMAIDDCGVVPDSIIIDGNPLHLGRGETCVVKGDGRIASIAAASIVAKVTRDALMRAADHDYPGYDLARSKGYASAAHIEAIRARGLTEFHRKTFCSGFIDTQETLF